MMVSLSGTLARDRAPVEETILFSSKGRNGNGVGSDPVAMMKFLASYFSPLTSMVVGEINEAAPGINVILFFWKRAAMPSLNDVTIFVFRFIISIKEDPGCSVE